MNRRVEQVKKLVLDDSTNNVFAKTTCFFNNMCCASYRKEQVVDDYGSGENSKIQMAFAWADIDEGGEEEYKSDGDWSTFEGDDFCEVISTSPPEKCKTLESNSLPSSQYPTKSPSGSISTATTVTMTASNPSWETLLTQRSSASNDPVMDDPEMDEVECVESKSSPPRTIAVLAFRSLNQRKGGMDFPDLPSARSMRQMHAVRLANYRYC
jgi:hypothetical protein